MHRSRRVPSRLAIGCMVAAVLPAAATPFVPGPQVNTFIHTVTVTTIVLVALALLFGLIARRPVRDQLDDPTPVTTVVLVDEVTNLTALARTELPLAELVAAGRAVLVDEAAALNAPAPTDSSLAELMGVVAAGRAPGLTPEFKAAMTAAARRS